MYARRSGFWASEYRLLRLLGFALGLGAGILMILGMGLVSILVGLVALLASVAILDGGTGGAAVMLVIGILTLILSGGIGGFASLLAIVSGVLGLAGGGFF